MQNVSNPVSLARLVMEKTSHCLLVGDGALKFAKKQAVPILQDPEALTSEYSRLKAALHGKRVKNNFDSMLAATMNTESLSVDKERNNIVIQQRLAQDQGHDTVGAVALDRHGNIACATSTGEILVD